ncbi:MAG: hypothetical protein HW386_2438 [Gammaproteobacteria bacterium]|nr:hypothetical protein [Gammaproteobacteria bacterium]
MGIDQEITAIITILKLWMVKTLISLLRDCKRLRDKSHSRNRKYPLAGRWKFLITRR